MASPNTFTQEMMDDLIKSMKQEGYFSDHSQNADSFFGMKFSETLKKPRGHQEYAENVRKDFPDWSDEGMERDYRQSGRKHFTAQVHAAAKTEYFCDWAATRLGLERKVAKTIIQQRLAGQPPSDIARDIARHSTIAEVRNSCETYVNEAKGP